MSLYCITLCGHKYTIEMCVSLNCNKYSICFFLFCNDFFVEMHACFRKGMCHRRHGENMQTKQRKALSPTPPRVLAPMSPYRYLTQDLLCDRFVGVIVCFVSVPIVPVLSESLSCPYMEISVSFDHFMPILYP